MSMNIVYLFLLFFVSANNILFAGNNNITPLDVAVESADVVLVKDSLHDVLTCIHISKAVIRNIKQNLFWAFFYNSLGIPIAAGLLYCFGGPLLSPVFAGAAMAFSSVSVVTNALRLRRLK